MSTIQVLIPVPESPAVVAGLPAVLRLAHRLAAEPDVGPIVLYVRSQGFQETWRDALAHMPGVQVCALHGAWELSSRGRDGSPTLILAPNGLPQMEPLRQFLEACHRRQAPAAWVWNGNVVAAFFPKAGGHPSPPAPDPEGAGWPTSAFAGLPRIAAVQDSWLSLGDPNGVQRAERELRADLRSDADGYLARYDRPVSIALSRLLARTPVTPNQITTGSLLVSLLGAWLLTDPRYLLQVLGAALLWSGCILDGCDGEVARLKLLSSARGAFYDLFADHLAHLATFAAIVLHIRRLRPGMDWLWPTVLLATGIPMAMLTAWHLILRQPKERRSGPQKVLERIASRDYVYPLLILVLVGRLDWFVWGAAVGSHIFWLGLWWLSRHPERP